MGALIMAMNDLHKHRRQLAKTMKSLKDAADENDVQNFLIHIGSLQLKIERIVAKYAAENSGPLPQIKLFGE